MSNLLFLERKLLPNHDTDPTQAILGDLAVALHGIAAQSVLEALGDTSGLPLEQREALCLAAVREVLHNLQFSLTAAPQSSLTPEILQPLSQAGAFAGQQIEIRFPQDEPGEQRLARLISNLRANIRTGQKN